MKNSLQEKLISPNEDIWELIDEYQDGCSLQGLLELMENRYNSQYEFVRNRALFVLSELPANIEFDWKSIINHIDKSAFSGYPKDLSQSAGFALSIVLNRAKNEDYLEKVKCIENIDFYDDFLREKLFINLFHSLSIDADYFRNFLNILIHRKLPFEHGLGISLFFGKVYDLNVIINFLELGNPVIEFYSILYAALYCQDKNEIMDLLPLWDIKGVKIKDFGNCKYSIEKRKFLRPK